MDKLQISQSAHKKLKVYSTQKYFKLTTKHNHCFSTFNPCKAQVKMIMLVKINTIKKELVSVLVTIND